MSTSATRLAPPDHSFRLHVFLGWLLLIALLVAVYWPGLHGGFIHDDFPSIVDNPDIQIQGTDWQDWVRAARSFPAGGRWLAMLSFAANYAAAGLSPFGFKLANLGIHLLNGALLYLCLLNLFGLWARNGDHASPRTERHWIALGITACWLLLPVQLTAVLYVVQRMESLSTTFVLLGLWLYLRIRYRSEAGVRSTIACAIVLVGCTAAGLLVKENAALLPLYAFLVEWALGSFSATSTRRHLTWLYALLLGVPMLLGGIWISTWLGGHFFGRQFDLPQRVMTEWRVLVDYIGWTLLPLPRSLSIYHDDYPISTGLFTPMGTALSLLLLLGMIGLALWQRRRRPLFALGIAWFFAGHVMTATVIPLELVYEHRNYFSSIGLLLALASLCALESPLRQRLHSVAVVTLAAVAFYAFGTGLRAREWGNPLRLAYSEAVKNPQSPRSVYELARTLVIAAGDDLSSPLLPRARDAMVRCLGLHDPGIMCAQGLIILAPRLGETPDVAWWKFLADHLRETEPSPADLTALESLTRCQMAALCVRQTDELDAAFQAALAHTPAHPRLLLNYSDFLSDVRGDSAAAERVLRDLIVRQPALPEVRANLTLILIAAGRIAEAREQLDVLHELDRAGTLSPMIKLLEGRIAAGERAGSPHTSG